MWPGLLTVTLLRSDPLLIDSEVREQPSQMQTTSASEGLLGFRPFFSN